MKLKPLEKQVIFITGATSGIGLATVHMAVEQGSKVFMVARSDNDLSHIQDEMRGKGYDTAYVVADVAEEDQIQYAADECIRTFGTIDTFVNNAGVSIYGKIVETDLEEAKRLFDTNFWGVVNGCRVAAKVMKHPGVIINVGSVLSEVAIPIQGIYSASKHAVKGFTDSFRRELLAGKSQLQVTLIKPSAIDTPYPEHAQSLIGEPVHTPPVYAPEVVAKAILHCAVKPTRELGVGGAAYIFPVLNKFFPQIQDKIMSKFYMEKDQSDNSQKLTGENRIHGHYPGHVMKTSLVTDLVEKKGMFKGTAIAGALAYLLLRKIKTF